MFSKFAVKIESLFSKIATEGLRLNYKRASIAAAKYWATLIKRKHWYEMV